MLEFIDNVTKSDVFVAVCAFLVANAGTILGIIIYAIKQGLKRSDDQAKFEEQCKEYVEECRDQCNKVLQDMSKLMTQLHQDVFDRINYLDSEQKRELEEKALNLTNAIAETKKQISIDELLEIKKEDK